MSTANVELDIRRSGLTDPVTNSRNQRSGKGRRRRAAAEQRRIEQQRWGQYLDDGDKNEEVDFVVSPTPVNRRRARRSSRRNSGRDEIVDILDVPADEFYTEYSDTDVASLDIALALSLSLADSATHVHQERNVGMGPFDMSYENLVQLEDVKCVVPPAVVGSLVASVFEEDENPDKPCDSCVICQNEYVVGEKLVCLPCKHDFHHACGSQWLLNYSKLCPVCKVDVTE